MRTTALLMLLFAVAASASSECSKDDHVSQRECLEQVAAKTESGVRNAETSLRSRIDGWDDEEEVRQKSRAQLAASSSAFQSYKMAQCELDASSAAGGNGAGDLRQMCVIALNRQYIKKLDMEAQWFEPAHAQPSAAPEKGVRPQ